MLARAKEGFTEETLMLAAQGIFLDPWDGRAQQDAFEYVLRPTNIAKFAELAELAESADTAQSHTRMSPKPREGAIPMPEEFRQKLLSIAGRGLEPEPPKRGLGKAYFDMLDAQDAEAAKGGS